MRRGFIVLCALVFCAGCGLVNKPHQSDNKKKTDLLSLNTTTSQTYSINNKSQNFVPDYDILAKVGNEIITRQDLEDAINTLNAQLKSLAQLRGQKPDLIDTKEEKKAILDRLVSLKLFYIEAKQRGLANDPKVKRQLEKQKQDVLVNALTEKLIEEVKPTDEEAMNEYEKRDDLKQAFSEPEKRLVYELAVDSEQAAKDILVQLLQGQISFPRAAKMYSVLPSAKNRGKVGYVSMFDLLNKGYDRKYIQQVFTAEEGVPSNIFKIKDKYYIIMVKDIRPAKERPWEEIKEQVKAQITSERLQKKQQEILDSVRKRLENKIEVYYDRLS